MFKLSNYIILFILLFFKTTVFYAQTDRNEEEDKSGSISYFKITGEAGVFGELYSISGRELRRPPSTGRMFFRPTLTFLENFSVSFDLFLSTEGSGARQQINSIAIHPEWSWGKAHIGEFSHSFSKFTLNGISMLGGGVELTPGILRLHLIGGRTQRAVQEFPYSSKYSRYLTGIKLGTELSNNSYLDINFLRIRDDVKSLPSNLFKRDSTSSSETSNYGVAPQENLVLGLNSEAFLFEKTIKLNLEIAGSIFTKNMYASSIEMEGFPSFINDIYRVRVSTNADYAFGGEIFYKTKPTDIKLGYSQISPGYTSLGLSTLMNDKKNFTAGTSIRAFQNKAALTINYQTQKDNILKQKAFTMSRDAYNIGLNLRPYNNFSFGVTTAQNIVSNDASNDTLKLDNWISSYAFNAMYQFNLISMPHSASVNVIVQSSKDGNILRKNNKFNSFAINFGVNTIINSSWSIAPTFGLNTSEVQNRSKTTAANLGIRVNNRLFNSRLNNTISGNISQSEIMQTSSIIFQSSYSEFNYGAITLSYRLNLYESKSFNAEFTENTLSLGYSYRF